MTAPRVTVLMAVYNAERYLGEALDSVLAQTFADFEFLIINDGSTDSSAEILASRRDARIRLVDNVRNLGLTASLNIGLALAKGEYVARMDADDVSRPERFARQVAFMDAHPEVGVCGGWVRFIPTAELWKLPATHEEIRCRQFSTVGVAHPAVMLRRAFFSQHGLTYDSDWRFAQDFELWSRALKHMKFANLQEVLLDYRLTPDQVGARHRTDQLACAARLRLQRVRELGIEPTRQEEALHEQLMNGTLPRTREALDRAEGWLLRLEESNRASGVYHGRHFGRWLLDIWFSACVAMADERICPLNRCLGSPLWSACGATGRDLLRALGAWVARKEFWTARRTQRA